MLRTLPLRVPRGSAAPARGQPTKGPSVWAFLAVSALAFASFTHVVARQVEAGETGRNRTASPLVPDPNMPVDEFYKPGERYPTFSERRALKAASAPSSPPPSSSSSGEKEGEQEAWRPSV